MIKFESILAIDVGKHGLGLALIYGDALADARYSNALGDAGHVLLGPVEKFAANVNEWSSALGGKIDTVLIEQPQAYSGAKQNANPKDIQDLNIVIGALMATCQKQTGGFLLVPPGTWKGQVPGDIMVERIKSKLSPDEVVIFDQGTTGTRAGLLHNVVDAVGLGLWRVGRIGK
jgi:hypothetical protein